MPARLSSMSRKIPFARSSDASLWYLRLSPAPRAHMNAIMLSLSVFRRYPMMRSRISTCSLSFGAGFVFSSRNWRYSAMISVIGPGSSCPPRRNRLFE